MPRPRTVNRVPFSQRPMPQDAPIIYAYDGSLEGFFCCVFESFLRNEIPFAIWPPERETPALYPVLEIPTDRTRADRVYRSLTPKLGAPACETILIDFLSCDEDKELHLLRFLHYAFRVGPGAYHALGHMDTAPLHAMRRHIMRETEKLMGFIRFEEHDGMLGAVIHPKNYILPMLRQHFCSRFPEEDFLIYDATHSAALVHRDHRAELVQLSAPLSLPAPDEREQQFQQLWKQFYTTLEIRERHNEVCRRNLCPKRYWADMTELRDAL